ncbi:MAG TPA: presqualene diphosphate synthase HpnD [Alphaproteobacteria bacterium]|nr:presqualene diphosphate synthase HpnD [Alphaproteobacteria bacterium]
MVGPSTLDIPLADDAALGHVKQITRRSGTSFFWAMRLLPPERRDAMFAIYAFCREVDDVADEEGALEAKRVALAAWRQEIERLYAGRPEWPTTRALRRAVAAYGLRREDFLAVIDGMEMDAVEDIRAPSLSALELYCARVAGAVGMLSVCVFGDRSERARQLAREEGRALQLTNILRDLREDAARGRLYLPRELLEKHGIATTEPAAVLAHANLGKVCDEVAALARASFAAAGALLAELDRRQMRPAIIMMEVYRRTLDALVARGWRQLDRAVGPSKLSKLWIAVRHGFL